MEALVRAAGALAALTVGLAALSLIAERLAPKDEREAKATPALSTVFLWGGEGLVWGGVPFLLYVLVGVLILAGILGGGPRLVMAGFLLSLGGVLVVAVLFNVWPRWVAGRL